MMTSDEVPPGSKHCTFVFGQDTFKPIVPAAAENPDKHNSRSDNWDAGSAMSYGTIMTMAIEMIFKLYEDT